MDWLQLGNSPSGQVLGEQALRGYMQSAENLLKRLMKAEFSIYEEQKDKKGNRIMVEFLQRRLQQCAAWTQPRQQKEPLAYPVFVERAKFADHSSLCVPFLSKEALVYDTACLGCFTGSRVSEYAQNSVPRGQRFNVIPRIATAGEWAGMPLAFICDDFTFYSKNLIRIPHEQAVVRFRKGDVQFLQVRFCL